MIYGKAERLLDKGRATNDAAKQYEEVDINHPYSQEARRAIVMAAYAYYKAGKYDDAVSAADRYLTLHPGTPESDLAQNIIGMCYYDQVLDPKRDQTNARKALAGLSDACCSAIPSRATPPRRRTAPASCATFSRQARCMVGRYYLRHNNFLAAINRFRVVVTDYQTTEQVEEALGRLTEAYMALGIINEAQTAAAVLGYNFPDSKWYSNAYALLQKYGLKPQMNEGSWITKTWKGDGKPA